MVAVVIFWAAVMAIFFFIIGVFVKGLAATFNALVTSIGKLLLFGGCGLGILAVLFAIHEAVKEIIYGNDGGILVFMTIILMGVIIWIVVNVGDLVVRIVVQVGELVIGGVAIVLDAMANYCEKAYSYFLHVLVKRLEKC